ncbi:MAG: S-adenosylmethionine:tRNA ribosyltransferase-isomerase, partial [bacterium]|nr:S-adenosylmethionine:tRNA ribosyltransferase-isomerase [bacterium]
MTISDTHSDDGPPRGRFPVTELDYDLPAELIAQEPAERRAESRLLLLDRTTGALQDRQFGDLVDLLHPRDVLVLNNTRVLPAKFRLCRRTGGRIDGLFLLEQADGSWEVLLRNAGRIKPDESLSFAGI